MRSGSCSGRSSARRISDFLCMEIIPRRRFSARDFFACRTYARRPCSCAVGAAVGSSCGFCCSGRVRTSSVPAARRWCAFSVDGVSDTDGRSGSNSRTGAFAVSLPLSERKHAVQALAVLGLAYAAAFPIQGAIVYRLRGNGVFPVPVAARFRE